MEEQRIKKMLNIGGNTKKANGVIKVISEVFPNDISAILN